MHVKNKSNKSEFNTYQFNSLDECLNYQLAYSSVRYRLASQENTNKNRRLNDDDLAPIVFGEILENINVKTSMKNLRVLLDSGASGSIIHSRFVKHNNIKKGTKVE